MSEEEFPPIEVLAEALLAAATAPSPFGRLTERSRITHMKWSPMTPENGQINDSLELGWANGPEEPTD